MTSVFLFPSCVPQGSDGHVVCCVADTVLLYLKQYHLNCQVLLYEFDSYVMVRLRVKQCSYISKFLTKVMVTYSSNRLRRVHILANFTSKCPNLRCWHILNFKFNICNSTHHQKSAKNVFLFFLHLCWSTLFLDA